MEKLLQSRWHQRLTVTLAILKEKLDPDIEEIYNVPICQKKLSFCKEQMCKNPDPSALSFWWLAIQSIGVIIMINFSVVL